MTVHNPAIVTTKYGRIEGNYEDGQYVFKGIPYAAAPVGNLRWREPQQVKTWSNVRPAEKFGPIAPQNPLLGTQAIADYAVAEPQNEDCLYLNIWTRGLAVHESQNPCRHCTSKSGVL